MKNKLKTCLESPLWKLVNSAFIIFLLTTSMSTCHKTKEMAIDINNSNKLAITNKNEVKVVIQSITKVEKEIANIKEAIHQHYSAIITEVFHKQDENVKIQLIPIPNHEGAAALFFKLNHIPEQNSIKIVTSKGVVVPLTTLHITRNIIMVQISGLTKLFSDSSDYYEVVYTPNFFENAPLFTLEEISMNKVSEGRFGFKLKENND